MFFLAVFGIAWTIGDGFSFHSVYGEIISLRAGNVVVEYDNSVFNISDVSIKYDDVWGPTMIGLIQNKDQISTIEGVSLSVQMYDRKDHLIGVMKGYPQASSILPNQKTAFEIQSGDEDIRNIHHVFIEILATDWGNSNAYIDQSAAGNLSNRPYMGIIGLALTPDISNQLGLNQTKGVLLSSITNGSAAEKADLHAGTTTRTMYNGREVNVGGDIILKIDNKEMSEMQDIMAYVSQKQIGDKVNLTIFRDNGIRNLDLILGKMPSQPPQAGSSIYSEELYDECVSVAGKSFCDFLFKK